MKTILANQTVIYACLAFACFGLFTKPLDAAPAAPPAIKEVRLYSKFTGDGGFNQTGWFLKNTSTSSAIKVTVKFTDLTKNKNNTYTRSYSLEPGEEKHIAVKTQYTTSSKINTAAKIVGARRL